MTGRPETRRWGTGRGGASPRPRQVTAAKGAHGRESLCSVPAPPLSISRPRCSGFTLIEVLAAITLLAIAFAVGLGALGKSAHNAAHSAALNTAVEHAQSLLAGQGLEAPLKDETLSGTFADGMRWTLKVRGLPRPASASGAAVGVDLQQGGVMMAQAAGIELYRLDVAVQFGAGRTLRLSTQRAQAAPVGEDQE